MTAIEAPEIPKRIPVNGKYIEFRNEQMIAWSVVAGLCGAAFVAGGYFLLLQMHWYIHVGSFNHGSSLKPWWDGGMGFIHSKQWVYYRHGLRNLGEPAVAFLAVGTLLAKEKYWDIRLPAWQLIIRLIALLVVAVGLIIGGVWLIINIKWLTTHDTGSWEYLLLGFIIGRILHPIWRPAGATLNGYVLDRQVKKAGNRTPLWVRKPLMPPVNRERFSWMQSFGKSHSAARLANQSKASLWLVTATVSVIVLVTLIGFVAHYWVGTGHSLWYMTG